MRSLTEARLLDESLSLAIYAKLVAPRATGYNSYCRPRTRHRSLGPHCLLRRLGSTATISSDYHVSPRRPEATLLSDNTAVVPFRNTADHLRPQRSNNDHQTDIGSALTKSASSSTFQPPNIRPKPIARQFAAWPEYVTFASYTCPRPRTSSR